MDALKFVKERNRLCKSFGESCDGCPANKTPAVMLLNGKKN